MNTNFRKYGFRSCDGYSLVDFLIVLVIILIIVTYVWTTVIQAQRTQVRSHAAQQFANYLEMARRDSMRRRATDALQMAAVTVLNDRFYSVRMDANGDGVLDAPVVVNLTDQDLSMNGPFPRTFMFDSSGKPLDANSNSLKGTQVIFANRGGKSAVTFSENSRATIAEPGMSVLVKN